jgi:hypothetical protein
MGGKGRQLVVGDDAANGLAVQHALRRNYDLMTD